MENNIENISEENPKIGAFDKFFGILKSDKSVSLEEMDSTVKKYAVNRIGGLTPFYVPDDFDNDDFSEFYESEIFPK